MHLRQLRQERLIALLSSEIAGTHGPMKSMALTLTPEHERQGIHRDAAVVLGPAVNADRFALSS